MQSAMSGLGRRVLLTNLLVLSLASGVRAHAGISPPEGEGAAQLDPQQARPARCASELRLVASVVNEKRPQLSLAVVRTQAGARVLLLGGRLNDLVLVELKPHYAELRQRDGALCVLPVFDTAPAAGPRERPVPAQPPREQAASAPADAKARAPFTQEELQHGLRALGDGDYTLSKQLLLKALKNPGGAAGGAHFRLIEKDGRAVGMEVRGVRDNSTLHRMGLRAGDVLQSINGIDVSSPVGLLDALRGAREAESFTIAILREGRARALRYLVQ